MHSLAIANYHTQLFYTQMVAFLSYIFLRKLSFCQGKHQSDKKHYVRVFFPAFINLPWADQKITHSQPDM